MAFANILWILLTFYTTSTYATVAVVGGTPAQQQAVVLAINEAITIANGMHSTIKNFIKSMNLIDTRCSSKIINVYRK